MKKIVFLFFTLVKLQSLFALQYSLSPSFRTYPLSGSADAQIRDEFLIWGKVSADKERMSPEWQYGFVQPKVTIGAHGLLEGQISLFPISILELSYANSFTERYYDSRLFNCAIYICKGRMNRAKSSAKLALGYESWFSILAFQQSKNTHADNSRALVDESENIILKAGGETLNSTSVFVGYRVLSAAQIGLAMRELKAQETGVKNEAQYMVFRLTRLQESLTLGLGRYSSDYSAASLSIIANYNWTWGSSISLF